MVGRRVGMTQLYGSSGVLMPVTVVEMCKASVVGVKTVDSDGYCAAVFGFSNGSAVLSADGRRKYDIIRELRTGDVGSYEVGTDVSVDEFANGELVDVIGTTKGKGFQGVMKRHGFSGGPASHGSMFHRRGGSYGQRQWPGHVFKGRKMPGHDGCVGRTVQNLEIVGVNSEKCLLIIRGSFPGRKGGYVTIRRAKKSLCKK
jgi:large subunit ribosomal protein L3